MTDTPRTDVEALAEALNAIGYGDLDENFIPADWLLSYLPAGWRLTNEAADERLRAALIRHRDLVHEEREHSGLADKCKWHVCEIANRALADTEDKVLAEDRPEAVADSLARELAETFGHLDWNRATDFQQRTWRAEATAILLAVVKSESGEAM